ncbi:MAG: 1-(5-phosphoribosyl)-5-[(5-phosphoribosylamino)methylideneamino]imidazole-4-carboxamide isomerase [Proteobacteria bacterium]|nr:1-(5-phosphoribosyl)-5-[(5-phosphoribosylamino)methylideneamino]imidazole-4-carboxamide isomerase [Pseudomonadota bacterium]
MILYPAIDLKDGKCVRLVQGDMNKATVFNDSPAEQATLFQEAGCEWLHIVDLNGAFAGQPMNWQAVRRILHVCPSMKIQLGGGIRDMKTIKYWIDAGISRVILGTAAVENPDFVHKAAKAFPDKIAVGIDAVRGDVATHGWAKHTGIFAPSLAKTYEDSGVSAIIYTDIERDGAMQGPNIKTTMNMANAVDIPVIASGGVSDVTNLWTLRGCGVPLDGVIVGRALYDKTLNITEALDAVKPLC